jgi:hypothetical protein
VQRLLTSMDIARALGNHLSDQNSGSRVDDENLGQKNPKYNKSLRFLKMKIFAVAVPSMSNLQRN